MNVARVEVITVNITGTSGSAETDLPVNGRLKAIHVAFKEDIPHTAKVTENSLEPHLTLFNLTANHAHG